MAQLSKFGPAESETKFGWRNLLSIWTWQTQICKCRPWPRFPQKATSYRKPWQATSSRIKILSPGLLFKSRGLCPKGLQIDCLKEKISLVDRTHGIVLEHVWNILNLYCAVICLFCVQFFQKYSSAIARSGSARTLIATSDPSSSSPCGASMKWNSNRSKTASWKAFKWQTDSQHLTASQQLLFNYYSCLEHWAIGARSQSLWVTPILPESRNAHDSKNISTCHLPRIPSSQASLRLIVPRSCIEGKFP